MRFIQLISVWILIFSLSGCGGTTNETQTETQTKPAKPAPQNYSNGSITLWDYLVPAGDTTNSYIKISGGETQKYRTRYTRDANTVTEISDLSKNEKTVYKNGKNSITVLFFIDNEENGRLELKPTVDIGDVVTVKKSNCTLAKLWEDFTFQGKTFKDVIEIECGDTPGYYQRGVGEILQKKHLAENGKVETKVLTDK